MNRLDAFRQQVQGAALIDNRVNMRYLTGYTGEGSLLVLAGKACILTDSRYTEQAGIQAPFCEVIKTTADLKRDAIVKQLMDEAGETSLFVEVEILTVKAFRALQEALTGIELKDLPDVCSTLRAIKTQDELDMIAKGAQISCDSFMEFLNVLHAGMTEKEARTELEYIMLKHGSEGPAFHTIVASGMNGSLPHAVPSDKVIENGDLVTFDFGASYGGYASDMTRTVAVGTISSELKAIYDAVYTAHMNALAAVKPGAVCKDIDGIARTYLDARYPGAFGHSLGHGVGLEVHEQPGVRSKGETVLVPGHVITIEPGVYLPGVGGCRIEDTVFVTEDGYFDPYTAPKTLLTI